MGHGLRGGPDNLCFGLQTAIVQTCRIAETTFSNQKVTSTRTSLLLADQVARMLLQVQQWPFNQQLKLIHV